MRPSRFTEEQIIGMLKEQEAGAATADVCRKHGISSATFYKFKAKYGGMDVSDARRLKTLDDENARLKKLLAEQMLDDAILKDVAAKNGDARCEAEGGGSCLHGACSEPASGVPGLDDRPLDGALTSTRPDDALLREAMKGVAAERRRFGYRRIHIMLDRQGIVMNQKKLRRLYSEEKLQVRRRGGRKRALGTRRPMLVPDRANVAGASTFSPTRSRTVAASGCSPSSTTIRASAWRSSPTPRSRVCA
jgi:putative transposase